MLDITTNSPDFACNVAHSVTGRAWRWRPASDRLSFALAERFDLSAVAARILASRGIDLDSAADFLTPSLRALLPDPSILTDMEPAAQRIARAIAKSEKIAVFGDYDVDGACSAALITSFLRGFDLDVLTHVPDRLLEGYGPNAPALKNLTDQGASLIICVDCGTAAADQLAILHGRADCIVLDHHKADGPPPAIFATVNPNRYDDTSGLHHLCAAGVAFLTAVATVRALRRQDYFATRPEPDLRETLDLVALATVCDVMQLRGVNRAFVAQGLKIMAKRARPGIAALLDIAGINGKLTAMSCGFGLGPRINAGGRIAEADLGLRLLLEPDPIEARILAQKLDSVNRERQAVEAGVLEAAEFTAAEQLAAGHAVLLITGPYHPGVVGIVAGRLREKFNRPACVGGTNGDLIKGSGRSTQGIDLGAAVIAAKQSGILHSGGGHAMAAGFGVAPDALAEFHAFLDDRLAAAKDAPACADLTIDSSISVAGANLDLVAGVERLAPFGPGNEEPMLVIPACQITRTDRIGASGNTLRAFAQDPGGARLKTILFRAGDTKLAQAIENRNAGPLHLAGQLRAESWQGRESVSFFVTDAARG